MHWKSTKTKYIFLKLQVKNIILLCNLPNGLAAGNTPDTRNRHQGMRLAIWIGRRKAGALIGSFCNVFHNPRNFDKAVKHTDWQRRQRVGDSVSAIIQSNY